MPKAARRARKRNLLPWRSRPATSACGVREAAKYEALGRKWEKRLAKLESRALAEEEFDAGIKVDKAPFKRNHRAKMIRSFS